MPTLSQGHLRVVSHLLCFGFSVYCQGSQRHAQPLPGSYFTSPPRQDSDAGRPVTAALTGCRLTCPKKQTTKPLDPHAFKSILDARKVDVAARNNHTKKGDSISFPVSWTIMIQSQGSIKLRDDETDIGTLDKIPQFRPPFEFVANDVLDESNPRDRVSDPGLTAKCDGGLLNAVAFFHMCCWYELLGPDICKHRTIYPAPPGCKQFREEAELNSNTCGSDLRTWMVSKLKYCTDAEASPTKAVNTTIKASMARWNLHCEHQRGLVQGRINIVPVKRRHGTTTTR